MLADLQRIAEQVPNKAHAQLLKGTSPAELILKYARDENCDLIIMGSRGQGGVKGDPGSARNAVVQGSPVAVLIAKDMPQREPLDEHALLQHKALDEGLHPWQSPVNFLIVVNYYALMVVSANYAMQT